MFRLKDLKQEIRVRGINLKCLSVKIIFEAMGMSKFALGGWKERAERERKDVSEEGKQEHSR